MAGRKTLINDALIDTICSLIEECATDKTACEDAGVSYRTFYYWIERGEKEDKRIIEILDKQAADDPQDYDDLINPNELPYLQFLRSITRARARALKNASKAVHKSIQGYELKETYRRVEQRPVLDKNGVQKLDAYGNPLFTQVINSYQKVVDVAPDWRAGMEFLERRDRANWSKQLSLVGNPDEPLTIEIVRVVKDLPKNQNE